MKSWSWTIPQIGFIGSRNTSVSTPIQNVLVALGLAAGLQPPYGDSHSKNPDIGSRRPKR